MRKLWIVYMIVWILIKWINLMGETMTFFFDTNVCIGYIFKWNPWHETAEEIFEKETGSHWSQTVKDESKNVFNILIKEYNKFLDNVYHSILESDKDIFNEEDILEIASEINVKKNLKKRDIIDKERVIKSIWEENGWYDMGKHDLATYLHNLSLNLNIISFASFSNCNNNLKLHPKASKNKDMKTILINEGIHFPDWQICLDANNIGEDIENLTFVTADHDLIRRLTPIINKTEIKEIFEMDKLHIFHKTIE
jgi:predicted nucleic acid-binding protein